MTDFWSEQRVFVTGASGFLGRSVVAELKRLGAGAIITPSHKQVNLLDDEKVYDILLDEQPTMVIHLAATVGGIGANSATPSKFFYDNILMNTYVLDNARRAGVAKFIGIGSVCSYPANPPIPFNECDLWDGYPEPTNAAYGLVKRMLLVQSQAYRQEFGYNAIHLILTNLYGSGGDDNLNTSHVIPAIIRKMLAAKVNHTDVLLWGDGSATRDFLHVEDAARAICLAAEHYDVGEPVNIGSGIEYSIKEIAYLIADLLDYQGNIQWDTDKPNGQARRVLNTNRAYDLFGFEASIGMKDGLRSILKACLTT